MGRWQRGSRSEHTREGDTLVVSRVFESRRKKAASSESTTREVETIRASLDGETMNLTVERQRGAGQTERQGGLHRQTHAPPVPPAPDLGQVKFAVPIKLFNGTDLSGWSVVDRGAPCGWKIEDGVLINDAKHEPGKHKALANIRTDQEFEDFNLTLETRIPEGGNSGIYLRGIYEVQVADTYGRDLDSHNIGTVMTSHHAYGIRRETCRPVADVRYYAGGPPRHRGAQW